MDSIDDNSIHFTLDRDVAKNALLYVVSKLKSVGRHKLSKILYYADMKHLVKYGYPITGDRYIKMENGPVPSYMYNMMKGEVEGSECLKRKRYIVSTDNNPDTDWLSETALECLDASIAENKDKTFNELYHKSHSIAWKSAKTNRSLSFVKIALEGGLDEKELPSVKENLLNSNLAI